jgi:multiple sugar transport system substrate-binding protein
MKAKLLVVLLLAATVAVTWATGTSEQAATTEGEETYTLRIPIWPDIYPETMEMIEAFQRENPNITFEYWETDPKEYRAQIFVQLAGGANIDIINTQNNAVYAELASRGMLYPVSELVERDNFDVSYLGPFYDGTKIDGVSYGLPGGTTAWVLYYNKDLFDAAGVAYPTDGMTWEDFYQKARAVTSGSGTSKVYGAYIHTWPICWMGPAVQTGATAIDRNLDPFQTALEFRKRLEDDGLVMPYFDAIAGNAHYSAAFYKGNVGMVPIGNWFISMLWQAKAEGTFDFDWDVVTMPVPDGVSPNTTWGMAGPVGIAARTEELDAAWEFLKFRSASKTAARISAEQANISFKGTEESRQIFLDAAEENGGPDNIDVLFNPKVYPEYPAVNDINYIINTIYKEEAELYFAGEQTSKQAIAAIKRRIQEEID